MTFLLVSPWSLIIGGSRAQSGLSSSGPHLQLLLDALNPQCVPLACSSLNSDSCVRLYASRLPWVSKWHLNSAMSQTLLLILSPKSAHISKGKAILPADSFTFKPPYSLQILHWISRIQPLLTSCTHHLSFRWLIQPNWSLGFYLHLNSWFQAYRPSKVSVKFHLCSDITLW